MNQDFIYRAIIKEKLSMAFNSIDFVYHSLKDDSPESKPILSMAISIQDAISTLTGMIEHSQKQQGSSSALAADIEKEITGRMTKIPSRLPKQRI